jgi:hypothetical protein
MRRSIPTTKSFLGSLGASLFGFHPSKTRPRRSKTRIMDIEPAPSSETSKERLPNWLEKWEDEFPQPTELDRRQRAFEASHRILNIAIERVLEPRTVRLVLASSATVIAIGAAEATLLCSEIPFYESFDAGLFVLRYSVENLLPSCIWNTADANLVVRALECDPLLVLRQFDPTSAADASTQLRVHFLASSRSIVAGFMLLAQLVRAVNISANAARIYEERIRLGQEPPLLNGVDQRIVRLCGKESDVTAVSLQRSGVHLFPVYEAPDHVRHLVHEYSDNGRSPVFWSVRPGYYGYGFTWDNFPVDEDCFIHSSTGRNILCLEADATNSDDPLSLGDHSLDLTIDDASQGFRRIQDLYKIGREKGDVPPFRTLRVFLGNSLEESKSGGGYSYTLRHRVRYAKEVDVLIDSKAPVLQQILRWCDRVAGKDRRVLFQTSSRVYFLNLQLIMRRYGYELYDPLDLRMLDTMKRGVSPHSADQQMEDEEGSMSVKEGGQGKDSSRSEDIENGESRKGGKLRSLMQVLLDEQILVDNADTKFNGDDGAVDELDISNGGAALRRIPSARALSRMPRLVYYETTMETVNAVQALVNAGEVDAANCCALLDKHEGMHFLNSVLNRKVGLIERRKNEQLKREVEAEMVNVEYEKTYAMSKEDEAGVQKAKKKWSALDKKLSQVGEEEEKTDSGLHIVCSSLIYDDLFRQVRQWARIGHSGPAIQKELDFRFQDIIQQSIEVRDLVGAESPDVEVEAMEQAVEAEVDFASTENLHHVPHVPPTTTKD